MFFRETIDGSIALRNLHRLRVDAIREAADECDLARKLQLHGALVECLLSPFAKRDVAGDAK